MLGISFLVWAWPLPDSVQERTVVAYQVPGRYAAWPANLGIWSWGNEILMGFQSGYFKRQTPEMHPIDHDRPAEDLLALSLDGGETWTSEHCPTSALETPVYSLAKYASQKSNRAW